MDLPKIKKHPRLVAALIETFGFSPALASVVALFVLAIGLAAVVWVVRSAPPRTVVLTSGPAGSSFQRYAEAYQKLLATHGVTLEVRLSDGSLDNLKRLKLPGTDVDIGFVQGGLGKDVNLSGLVSLGSIAYQPLWVFYRSPTPLTRLSELSGRKIAIGSAGSGTHALALTLLSANGITGAPTTFLELDADAAAAAMVEGKLDAVFTMGDSTSMQTLRNLVRTPGVQLFNFSQAEAYVRRFPFLNKIELPEGAVDLGKNLPSQDVTVIGPTVELVARKGLNSALSELLLEAVQEVHGKASVLQKRGEFPMALEHEIPISSDAQRYYKSGRSWIYHLIPSFWIANLINRILVAIVPLLLVFIPALRLFPVVYRWSIQSRIYRHYRPLLRLERDAFGPLTKERIRELLRQVDEIEEMTGRIKVPASFANQFYELRGHLAFVRRRLEVATPVDEIPEEKR